VDSTNNRITWHKAGRVTFAITDTTGRTGTATFSPTKFFKPFNVWETFANAKTRVENAGMRRASYSEITSGQHVRKLGTLWGEWGNFVDNGSGWPIHTETEQMTYRADHEGYVVWLGDGRADTSGSGGGWSSYGLGGDIGN